MRSSYSPPSVTLNLATIFSPIFSSKTRTSPPCSRFLSRNRTYFKETYRKKLKFVTICTSGLVQKYAARSNLTLGLLQMRIFATSKTITLPKAGSERKKKVLIRPILASFPHLLQKLSVLHRVLLLKHSLMATH